MFEERLKILRKEYKMSQADLAKLSKMSSSAISMYEQGLRDPDTETVIFFSKYFDVSTDWILGVSNIRNPYIYISQLSNEDVEKVNEYIKLLKLKYK